MDQRSFFIQLETVFSDYQTALSLKENGRIWDCYLKLAVVAGQLSTLEASYPKSITVTNSGMAGCFDSLVKMKGCVEKQIGELHGIISDGVSKLKLSSGLKEDFGEAIEEACQSRVRFTGEGCEKWFRNIIGLAKPKSLVEQGFIYPLIYPNMFGKLAGGVLFYGPPGTGKTMMAMAAINELGYKIKQLGGEACYKFMFFAPSAEKLKGKYVGETEKRISNIFVGASALACKKRSDKTPVISVIFFDEVDSIAASGRSEEGSAGAIAASSVNVLLQYMQGASARKNVIVMAATNFPNHLDSAFLRRLPYQIPIDLPTENDLAEMLDSLLSKHVDEKKHVHGAERLRDYKEVACASAPKMDKEECEDIQTCEEQIFVDSKAWKTSEAAPFLGEKLKPENIRAIAAMCAKKNYSGSDMETMFNTAVKMAGAAALNNEIFLSYKTHKGGEQRYISMLYATPKTTFSQRDVYYTEPDPRKQHLLSMEFLGKKFSSKYETPVVDSNTEFSADTVLYGPSDASSREFLLVFNIEVTAQTPFTTYVLVHIKETKATEASLTSVVGTAFWNTISSGQMVGQQKAYDSWVTLYVYISKWLFASNEQLAEWASTPEAWADSSYTWWLFFREYIEGVYLAKPARPFAPSEQVSMDVVKLNRVVVDMTDSSFAKLDRATKMWWYDIKPKDLSEAEAEKTCFLNYKRYSHVPLFKFFNRHVVELTKRSPQLSDIIPLLSTDRLEASPVSQSCNASVLDPKAIKTLKLSGQGCVNLMQLTSAFVNWHLSPLHLVQAIAATHPSFNKKEYNEFKQWRDKK
jgi:SpoVK/Ycf46/Vps4 family AAA+-type ATPase